MTNDDGHANGDGSDAAAAVSLNELSLKFHRLKQIHDEALSWKQNGEIRPDWQTKRSSVEERMLIPIREELTRLIWLAAQTQANTAVEANLKAGILLAGLSARADDPNDALAQSLAKDVLKLF